MVDYRSVARSAIDPKEVIDNVDDIIGHYL